ncbi:MAG: cell division protein SepF [Cyanobacteria bacterium P01_F01_bin.150]
MSFRQRLQELLGLHQAPDSYDNGAYRELPSYEEADEPLEYEDEIPYRPERESNVIAMPGLSSFHSELVVMEPASFQEVPAALIALRDRKVVVLNLSHMDGGEAQRSVDYVAGGTFALNGHQERIGKNVFLFTPHSVQITSQAREMAMGGSSPGYPPAAPAGSQMSAYGGMNPMTQEQEMLRKLELRAGQTPPPPPPPPRHRPRF